MGKKFGCVELNGVVIYNTTPHTIRFFSKDGEVWLEIPRASEPLYVPEINRFCGALEGVPIFSRMFGGDYLPSPQNNVYFIVRADVATVFHHRNDFLIPYGAEESDGVINCIGLAFME